ncbi:NAD-dependent epimerase [Desulfothermus naphthae]
MDNVLVTGCAGFIGFHVCKNLLESSRYKVIGIDNLNPYYSVKLKQDRLNLLLDNNNFSFYKISIEDRNSIEDIFKKNKIRYVIHLAAQAGVRHSLKDPYSYIDSNIVAFINLLEGCRHTGVEHLVFASSSSVYGLNTKMPFSVKDNVDHPISLYAATKKANELMAHTYSYLYALPCTGLRFFTVYGPWGRPDMALFKFTKAIIEDRPIDVYNYGKMERDFTYIDDIVEGVIKVMGRIPEPNQKWSSDNPDPSSSICPYKIYNIGNNRSVSLERFIEIIEKSLGKKAKKNYMELQPGDVPKTYADIEDLTKDIGFRPKTKIEEGIPKFIKWYIDYFKVKL